MLVYKFGGASIATPERIQELLPIIKAPTKPVVLVVSALGKTTNALEVIVATACKGDKQGATKLAQKLEQDHLDYAKTLLDEAHYKKAVEALGVYFTELQWGIDGADSSRYDYSYDQ